MSREGPLDRLVVVGGVNPRGREVRLATTNVSNQSVHCGHLMSGSEEIVGRP